MAWRDNGSPATGSVIEAAEWRFHGKVLEAHELFEVGQGDLAGRTVTLLGDEDFQGAFVLAGFVELGTMQEHDSVGVLLNGSRFAKIGEARLVVLPIFQTTIELSQRDDRYFQLAGKEFQSPRNLGHLLLPVVTTVVRIDQLQVVNENDADPMAQFQPAGIGSDAQHPLTGGVID